MHHDKYKDVPQNNEYQVHLSKILRYHATTQLLPRTADQDSVQDAYQQSIKLYLLQNGYVSAKCVSIHCPLGNIYL